MAYTRNVTSPDEDGARIDDIVAQACRLNGWVFRCLADRHYFTGESVYCDSLMFAAALAMKTSKVRLGFAVVQTPFHHPVRLAVQLALLDNLSKGRIDVGIGKGTAYNGRTSSSGTACAAPTATRAHGRDGRYPAARLDRVAARLRGRFHKLHVPAIRPKPVQQPGPPLWRRA